LLTLDTLAESVSISQRTVPQMPADVHSSPLQSQAAMTDISTRLDEARDQTSAPYLTVEEAAKLARCNPKTIRRAFTDGRLRAFRPAHRVLLREDDVRAWVEGRSAVEVAPGRRRSAAPRSRRPATGSVASLKSLEREVSR